jgi:hypothetical protein
MLGWYGLFGRAGKMLFGFMFVFLVNFWNKVDVVATTNVCFVSLKRKTKESSIFKINDLLEIRQYDRI